MPGTGVRAGARLPLRLPSTLSLHLFRVGPHRERRRRRDRAPRAQDLYAGVDVGAAGGRPGAHEEGERLGGPPADLRTEVGVEQHVLVLERAGVALAGLLALIVILLGLLAVSVMELAVEAAELGNLNAISDAGSAVALSRAALTAAGYNVRINLQSIRDVEWVAALRGRADALEAGSPARAASAEEQSPSSDGVSCAAPNA